MRKPTGTPCHSWRGGCQGSIQVAKFTDHRTGRSKTYALPANFRERAVDIPSLPSWFREKTSFLTWRKHLYREMAVDIWSRVSTLTIHRPDPKLLRVTAVPLDVIGVDEFFLKVGNVGETIGGVIAGQADPHDSVPC